MKAMEIIKNLINVIGSSVGVVLIAIGSVMLLNSLLKLYVFDLKSDAHFQAYRCDNLLESEFEPVLAEPLVRQEHVKDMSDEERKAKYEECVVRETVREEQSFVTGKKHAMIDGMALLIVGVPILLFYTRRAKKD